jgi:hypothetical protein
MNNKILDIIKTYSVEFNFNSNLQKLIEKLNEILVVDSNKTKQMVLKYKYMSDDNPYGNDIDDDDEIICLKNIFKKIIKQNLIVTEFKAEQDNSEETWYVDMLRYQVLYLLDEFQINFKFEIFDDDREIVHATIEIVGIIEYTMVDYDGPYGHSQSDGDTGVKYYKPQEVEYFYHRYNENNVFESIYSFYNIFIQSLLSSMVHELKINYNDCTRIDIDIDINLCSDTIDNSYILK